MNDRIKIEAHLGVAATAQLFSWYGESTIIRFVKVLDDGGSGVPVVAIHLYPPCRHDTKLVVKQGSDGYSAEVANDAWRSAGPFRIHLAQPLGHCPVGGAEFLQFQQIAGGNLRELVPLSSPQLGSDKALDRFGCVVRSVLLEWDTGERREESMRVSDFMSACLRERMREDGRVNVWARSHKLLGRTNWLLLPGEVRRAPNPLVLLADDGPGAADLSGVRLGPTHNDLHPGNVLVKLSPRRSSDFVLIDLDRYSARGPLACDIAQLFLCMLRPHLGELREDERGALISALADRVNTGDVLPTPVLRLLECFDGASCSWARQRGLADDWEAQQRVAMIACALMFLGRPVAQNDGTWVWFLRLAARIMARMLEDWGMTLPHGSSITITP